jgi:hydrogenase maturation factor
MKITDRVLFLKYALPCASTLIKRGDASQHYIDNLVDLVSNGRVPKEDAEQMFKIANAMCNSVATRMKRNSIDTEVIRQYFLMEHSKVVDDRFELMGDFDPVDCKTYAGKVLEVHNGSAVVETALGQRKYRTIFVKSVKKDDNVAVHFDFIVEKITNDTANKMNEIRAAYEESKSPKL